MMIKFKPSQKSAFKAQIKSPLLITCLSCFVTVMGLTGCNSQENEEKPQNQQAYSTDATLLFSTNKQVAYKSNMVANQSHTANVKNTLLLPQKNTLIIYMPEHALKLKKVLQSFTKEKNINVSVFTVGDSNQALLETLKKEGKHSSADIVILTNGFALQQAKQADLFQAVNSEQLNKSLHASYRSDNQWYGLANHLNVIVTNTKTKSLPANLTYKDFATAPWQGKLCIKPKHAPETRELFARYVQQVGSEKAHAILLGWEKNRVSGMNSDKQILAALSQGKCEVGLVSELSFVTIKDKENLTKHVLKPMANNQVTIVGAGVSKYAPNPLKALALIEWLSTEESQILFNADSNTQPVVNSLLSATSLQAIKQKAQIAKNIDTKSVSKTEKKKQKRRQKKSRDNTSKKSAEKTVLANTAIGSKQKYTEENHKDPLLASFNVKSINELTPEQASAYAKQKRLDAALRVLANQSNPDLARFVRFIGDEELINIEKFLQNPPKQEESVAVKPLVK